jgi:hypothetical protein
MIMFLREPAVWSLELGGRIYVGACGRSMASVTVKMFSHRIYFIKTFHKFYTFSGIPELMVQYNLLLFQYKRV